MSIDSTRARRQKLIDLALEKGPNADIYGGNALLCLIHGGKGMKQAANEELVRAAKWFVLPHPHGRDPMGEPDFAANKLARALRLPATLLEEQTKEEIIRFFTGWNFESKYKSENHMLLFHTARYLAADMLQSSLFAAYGKTGAQLVAEDEAFIREFLLFRVKRGWAEFDSMGYAAEIAACLLNLAELSPCGALRTLAEMTLNVQLLDMVADSLGALYGGAHGRIYEGMALDYANAPMFALYYLYFGHTYEFHAGVPAEALLSPYEPAGYVKDAAAARPPCYESFESKHLHCISCDTPHRQVPQVEGSINKYTYITPRYVMGAVNFQDAYPKDSEAAWYAHHQQHEWDLTLAGGTDIRIFTHHPGSFGAEGKEHGTWTGDLGCGCGQFFCHKNVTLATYRIPENELQWIHANVPFAHFELVQDGNFLFLCRQDVYAALWFSGGYVIEHKGEYSDREVKSYGSRHGVVCVADTKENCGSFAAFIQNVKAAPPVFDQDGMTLTFGGLYMNDKTRKIGEKEVVFPYPTYRSPIMNEPFGSGVVTVHTDKGVTVLNFNE